MPSHYDDHFEDDTQEWDTVVLESKKSDNEKKPGQMRNMNEFYKSNINNLPLHKKIFYARQRSKFTANQLASILKISLKEYQEIEEGYIEPTKACLNKLRKYIEIK